MMSQKRMIVVCYDIGNINRCIISSVCVQDYTNLNPNPNPNPNPKPNPN